MHITAEDLLAVPEGDITEEGLRWNINVGVLYLEAWLRGNGCVPLYNLMEDAATAEISRAQVWQWVKHGVKLKDGRTVTADLVRATMQEELAKVRSQPGGDKLTQLDLASRLFEDMMTRPDFTEFLTLSAYNYID
jgi:malate synthase